MIKKTPWFFLLGLNVQGQNAVVLGRRKIVVCFH